MTKKQSQRLRIALLCLGTALLSLSLSSASLATQTTDVNTTQTVSSGGSSSSACSYFFSDIYDGTLPPATLPAASTFQLKFYNNGVASPTTPPLPCSGSGTYKVVFTIEIQATTNVGSISVVPTVVAPIDASTSVPIYPTANAPTTLYLYPQCNNASYASTPYCTIGEISGSAVVSLVGGMMIGAPSFTTSAPVQVVGGQFIAYLISSP